MSYPLQYPSLPAVPNCRHLAVFVVLSVMLSGHVVVVASAGVSVGHTLATAAHVVITCTWSTRVSSCSLLSIIHRRFGVVKVLV